MTNGRVTVMEPKAAPPEPQSQELKDVLLVLRQALLMVVCFIEKKYGIERKDVLR